jgi:hypothetical protein
MTLRKPIDVRCMWQMWGIVRIELLSYLQWNGRYVQLNISGRISKTAITVDRTGHRVDIVQNGWCAPCLAANEEYNAHRIVDIPPIAAETHAIEYLCLNMQNCNYKCFCRDQGWHCKNRLIGAVFCSEWGVQRASNLRHTTNIRGDTINCILKPKYPKHPNTYVSQVQSWHCATRLVYAVFGSKCAVQRGSNCRNISNGNADTFNWIFQAESAKLQ